MVEVNRNRLIFLIQGEEKRPVTVILQFLDIRILIEGEDPDLPVVQRFLLVHVDRLWRLWRAHR